MYVLSPHTDAHFNGRSQLRPQHIQGRMLSGHRPCTAPIAQPAICTFSTYVRMVLRGTCSYSGGALRWLGRGRTEASPNSAAPAIAWHCPNRPRVDACQDRANPRIAESAPRAHARPLMQCDQRGRTGRQHPPGAIVNRPRLPRRAAGRMPGVALDTCTIASNGRATRSTLGAADSKRCRRYKADLRRTRSRPSFAIVGA